MRLAYDGLEYGEGLTGPQSGLIEGQLVRIFPLGSFFPPAGNLTGSSNGAAPTTLPGNNVGGAATDTVSTAASGGMATTAMASQGAGGDGKKILGLPALVFYILVAFLVGYIFVWQVHFK